MSGWRAWIPRIRRDERGISEATSAIIVLPLLAMLLFMLVETGMNIRYRLLVDNVVQTAVRGVALDGGDCNTRTGCTGADKSWSRKASETLNALCTNSGRCTAAGGMNSVTCSPAGAANEVGDEVYCQATVTYKPLSGLSTNPVTCLGFCSLFSTPFTTKIYSSAGVGQK